MKNIWLFSFILSTIIMCSCKSNEPVVLIQTTYGDIKVKLYNETPKHRDNFLKLADQGFYNGLIFHRVIENFMIQGGDSKIKYESDTVSSDEKTLGDTISAEIKFPLHYHKRGALAAARWGDAENPTKASDASQFYIVTGELRFDDKLNEIEKQRFERLKQNIYNALQSANMDTIKEMYKEGNRSAITNLRAKLREQTDKEAESRKAETLYTEEQRETYKTRGGTPHLDGEYSVFGEVIEGMDVVDKIQKEKTNSKDRPLKNIVMKVTVLSK